MKTYYSSFNEWNKIAYKLGWVHTHDEFIVIDDEDGLCVGEFDSKSNTGWIQL